MTETACDLANAAMQHSDHMPRHRLEEAAHIAPPTHTHTTSAPTLTIPGRRSTPLGGVSCLDTWAAQNAHFGATSRPPVAVADVYVDDFLLTAQTKRQQTRLLRATLHAIDAVLRPLAPGDPSHRKEPSSVKKLLQGDAHWDTRKLILGWQLDTVEGTLGLPPHRVAWLYKLLDTVQPPRKRLPLKEWHKLLGELRSMAPGLPGSRGLFSVLQDALSRGDKHRLRLNRHVFDTIADFQLFADSLAHRPIRLRELVPVSPSDSGACDACRRGMGGVWFALLQPHSAPILWRAPFPDAVQQALVTAEHPLGTLSISDLELVGTIAHKDVLAMARHVHERTLWVAGDNKASLSWETKGSATSDRARAYLLRLNALHQRAHRYVSRHHFIAGTSNSKADDASRLWHLSDSELLTHFKFKYKLIIGFAPYAGREAWNAYPTQRVTAR